MDPPKHRRSTMSTLEGVACPFCSLLCDDLVIQNQNGELKVRKNGCARALSGFERPRRLASPRVGGAPAGMANAHKRAAVLLRTARQPLYAGLGTDVAGMRAVMSLADRTGGVVDHVYSEDALRNVQTLQSTGWITTTLTEIRNRADLLVFAGTDTVRDHPRFFERVVWNAHSMFDLETMERDVVYLGRGLDAAPGTSPKGRKPLHLKCDPTRLAEMIFAIRALLAGGSLQAKRVAGIKASELQALGERMKQAKYGVLVWSPADLAFPHADVAIEALSDLVRDLNQTTRFAGFSLGGNDGGVTANSVCSWQSGYPVRTSFGRGYPEFDPWHYSTKTLLGTRGADAVVWIASFAALPPPAVEVPLVVLGPPDIKLTQEPEVFIPVATPGVDHAGQLVRCDNTVSLPLRQLRESPLPSVASTLSGIERALSR